MTNQLVPLPPQLPAAQPIPPHIQKMTPKQLQEMLAKPSREEVEKLFRDVAQFRIDIESNSTIRADLAPRQEAMASFLSGTAQFLQAVGPMVQDGTMPRALASEIYAGFARSFNLGKQAEDAIDRAAAAAKESDGQPPKPDPKLQLETQRLQFDTQRAGIELQMKQAEAQGKLALERQKAEQDARLEEMRMHHELQLNQQKHEFDMQVKREQAELDAQLSFAERQQEFERKLARDDELARHAHQARVEREGRMAMQPKPPRKMRAKIVRGADGRPEAYEVSE